MMPTQVKIEKIERPIIEYFIFNNNKVSWLAKIGKDLNKNLSNVLKQIKKLENKSILKRIDCPDKLIEKIKKERKQGGSFPSDCYLLNYDMNPEWFVEIARPYFDNDIKKMGFMKSRFTHQMIHSKKFINWVIENRLTIKVNDDEKYFLPFIFVSFPSSLQWALFGDLNIIDKCISDIVIKEPEANLRRHFYFAYINNMIIEDFVKGEYIQHKFLSQMKYNFKTEFGFLNLFSPKSKETEGKISYGGISGGFTFEFKKIPRKKIYKKDAKKQ